MWNGLFSVWQEMAVACFRALWRYSTGGAELIHGNLQQLKYRPKRTKPKLKVLSTLRMLIVPNLIDIGEVV
jgi:hypothetical protein